MKTAPETIEEFEALWTAECEEWIAIRDRWIEEGREPSAYDVTAEQRRRMHEREELPVMDSVFARRLLTRTLDLRRAPRSQLKPGMPVELLQLDPPKPAKFLARPFAVGDRGRVVRLVHYTVEGEPLNGDAAATLVHVLFDGQDHAIAFPATCLRRLDEDEAPSPDRWGYAMSPDAEFWQGAGSREEAIDSGRECAGPGGEFWIQRGEQAWALDHVPDASDVIETMEQSAADNGCPDEVDDPFVLGEGAEAALDRALTAWAEQYVTCNWWVPTGKPERVGPESEGA